LPDSALYPDPPHLSAAVYGGENRDTFVFMEICEAVKSYGSTPSGVLEVIPADASFRWLTDLSQVASTMEVADARFWEFVNGDADGFKVLRAGFKSPTAGTVVVSYEPGADKDGQHCCDAHISAGGLGIPDIARTTEDRAEALKVASWIRELMKSVCRTVRPLYGAVTVEESLPTPGQLHNLHSRDLYFSDQLLSADPSLASDLLTRYGEARVERWDSGLFCVAWDELAAHPGSIQAFDTVSHWPADRLGRAVSTFMAHRQNGVS
jgi:hypothetical protein